MGLGLDCSITRARCRDSGIASQGEHAKLKFKRSRPSNVLPTAPTTHLHCCRYIFWTYSECKKADCPKASTPEKLEETEEGNDYIKADTKKDNAKGDGTIGVFG